jgi:hypothetical protein
MKKNIIVTGIFNYVNHNNEVKSEYINLNLGNHKPSKHNISVALQKDSVGIRDIASTIMVDAHVKEDHYYDTLTLTNYDLQPIFHC